jgi:hypothetical protein
MPEEGGDEAEIASGRTQEVGFSLGADSVDNTRWQEGGGRPIEGDNQGEVEARREASRRGRRQHARGLEGIASHTGGRGSCRDKQRRAPIQWGYYEMDRH